MPSSRAASSTSAGAGDGNVPDQFPAGLRVLAVDDDAACLTIIEKMLQKCKYEVTKCNRAEVALSLLRENKNGFDVVISDVHMPDMDGFKLLSHIGLEMDLPVIMMSADDSKNVVMKGITHGACDYLIKPVRIEALRTIWQHVVRKKKHHPQSSPSLEEQQKQPDYSSSANEGQNCKNTKRRKDDEDESEEQDGSSSLKKPRVAWSVNLHQQFVAAVNQIGIDKAVPKKILDLMSVPGLTRENVASHLQKYRLYLKRLSGSQQSGGTNPSFVGNQDVSYGSISSLSDLDLQTVAASGQLNHLSTQSLATLQAGTLGRSTQPLIDHRNIFSFENPNLRFGHAQNRQGHNGNITKQMNLLHGIPTTMEPKQLVGLQHSFVGMNSQCLIPMIGQSQSQNYNSVSANPAVSQASSLDLPANHTTGNSFPLRGSLGIPNLQQDRNIGTKVPREGYYGLSDWGLQGVDMTFDPLNHTNTMQAESNLVQENEYNQDDLLTTLITQQDLPESGFGSLLFDYSLDNLPATR